MTHDEDSPGTQEDSPRKRRPSGDEGAACTKRIMDEVKGRRATLRWSAERLADEMTAAGVPWTRDIVVNLENGRRNTLAVHELLALAWVLDVPNPADLIVSPGASPDAEPFPVTPAVTAGPEAVRAWFGGRPLRTHVTAHNQVVAVVRQVVDASLREGKIDEATGALFLRAAEQLPVGASGLPGTDEFIRAAGRTSSQRAEGPADGDL